MNHLNDIFGTADNVDWMDNPHRPCAWGHPDEWFHPAADLGASERERGWAKALCSGCPVATQCLTYALDNNEMWGVWGGTTANERAAALRKKGTAA
jgi:hypothetical protein